MLSVQGLRVQTVGASCWTPRCSYSTWFQFFPSGGLKDRWLRRCRFRLQNVEAKDSIVQNVESKVRFTLGLFTQFLSQTRDFRQDRSTLVDLLDRSALFSRVFRYGIWLFHTQADLPSSYINMHVAGPLRSTGITRCRHYYGPLRLPSRAARSVICSRDALKPSVITTGYFAPSGLPSSWLFFRRPPPPTTPDRPTTARVCCFIVGNRLRHLWQVDRDHASVTRPNRVHAHALRLTSSPSRASSRRITPPDARLTT